MNLRFWSECKERSDGIASLRASKHLNLRLPFLKYSRNARSAQHSLHFFLFQLLLARKQSIGTVFGFVSFLKYSRKARSAQHSLHFSLFQLLLAQKQSFRTVFGFVPYHPKYATRGGTWYGRMTASSKPIAQIK